MPSFFEQLDEQRFRATDYAIGPWGPETLHGGPPCALLGRFIERAPSETAKKVTRVSFDFFKPVPLATFDIDVQVVRPGKRVDLVEATLVADGTPIMRAAAWRIVVADIKLPVDPPVLRDPPEKALAKPTFMPPSDPNYLTSMEWRFLDGEFLSPGPASAWLRMRHPLIQGEESSPLTRVLAAVDSASGISAALDFQSWLFVNVDLVVNLNRYPEGEWVGLDAATILDTSGVGLARSTIFDERGNIGASSQSLFIAPR